MQSTRAQRQCQYCERQLTDIKPVGRYREYCGDRCRSAAQRQRYDDLPGRADQDFAAEFDQALSGSARTSRWLSHRLENTGCKVGVSTLSNWRTGRSVPPDTEHTINRLLALERLIPTEPGRLVAAFWRTVPPTAPSPAVIGPRTGGPEPVGLKAMLDAHGLSNFHKVLLVEGRDAYRVGPDGAPLRSDHTSVLWALRSGIRRYWLILVEDRNLPVRVEAGEGCRVGRAVSLSGEGLVPGPGYRMLAFPLILATELVVGEPRTISYSVLNPIELARGPVPLPGWGRVVTEPGCRSLRMDLHFDPRRLPNDLWETTWRQRPGLRPMSCLERSAPLEQGTAGRTLTNPMPGTYGFQWRWPSPDERAVVRPGTEQER